MRRVYRYVDDWGDIYRMTERNYLRFMRAGAAGKRPEPDQYGKRVARISFTTTDANPSEFQFQLECEATK